MNRKLMLVVLACSTTLPAFAQEPAFRDYADVVSVRERVEQVNRPTERCWTESVESAGEPRERSLVGPAIGAIAGGIVGHQVGRGFGRDVATGVGVLAGAVVGDNLSRGSDRGGDPVRKCQRQDNWVRVVNGYDVTYRYGGRTFTTVTSQEPGRVLEVEVGVTPVVR